MFESLIGLVAIIALFVIISRQQSRIGLVERELGALRSLVLSGAVRAAWPSRPNRQRPTASRPMRSGRCGSGRYRLAIGERDGRRASAGYGG